MLFLKNKMTSVTAALMAALLASCASAPNYIPSTDERLQSIEFVLKSTYEVQQLAQLCLSMSSSTQQQASAMMETWYALNWPHAASANAELEFQQRQWAKQYGELASVVRPVLWSLDVDAKEKDNLFRINNHWGNRDERCLRQLKEKLAEQATFELNDKQASILSFLRALHPAIGEPKPVLLEYRGAMTPSLKLEGRYVMTAESYFMGQCANPRVIKLNVASGSESYGALCDNGKSAAMSCQWGKCTLLK